MLNYLEGMYAFLGEIIVHFHTYISKYYIIVAVVGTIVPDINAEQTNKLVFVVCAWFCC